MEDLKPRPQILAISVPIQPCRRTTNLELNVLIFIGEQGMIMIMLIRHANDDRRSLKQPPFAVRVVKVICPTSTRNLRERWYNIQFKGFGPFACGTYKNLQKRVTKKNRCDKAFKPNKYCGKNPNISLLYTYNVNREM